MSTIHPLPQRSGQSLTGALQSFTQSSSMRQRRSTPDRQQRRAKKAKNNLWFLVGGPDGCTALC